MEGKGIMGGGGGGGGVQGWFHIAAGSALETRDPSLLKIHANFAVLQVETTLHDLTSRARLKHIKDVKTRPHANRRTATENAT